MVTVQEFFSEWPYRVSALPPGLIRRHSGSVGERANVQPSGVVLIPPELCVGAAWPLLAYCPAPPRASGQALGGRSHCAGLAHRSSLIPRRASRRLWA